MAEVREQGTGNSEQGTGQVGEAGGDEMMRETIFNLTTSNYQFNER